MLIRKTEKHARTVSLHCSQTQQTKEMLFQPTNKAPSQRRDNLTRTHLKCNSLLSFLPLNYSLYYQILREPSTADQDAWMIPKRWRSATGLRWKSTCRCAFPLLHWIDTLNCTMMPAAAALWKKNLRAKAGAIIIGTKRNTSPGQPIKLDNSDKMQRWCSAVLGRNQKDTTVICSSACARCWMLTWSPEVGSIENILFHDTSE